MSFDQQPQASTTTDDERLPIVIVGGGPAGLALGVELALAKVPFVVLERRTREDLVVNTNSFYDISRSGTQALLRIGGGRIARRLASLAVPLRWTTLYSAKGKRICELDSANGPGAEGIPAYNLLRSELLSTMLEVLEETLASASASEADSEAASSSSSSSSPPSSSVRFSCNVREIDFTSEVPSVTLADGETIRARLVVGADGIHSVVRKRVFGDTGFRSDGIVACWGVANDDVNTTTTNNENDDANQSESGGGGDSTSTSTNTNTSTSTSTSVRPGGEGHLAMRGTTMVYGVRHSRASLWAVTFDLGEPYVTVPPLGRGETWKSKVLAATATVNVPIVDDLIHSTPEGQVCATMCADRRPLSTFVRGKIVLLGDSAHPFTPFAGQGASQAMVDAVVLSHMLLRHHQHAGDGDDVGAIQAFDEMVRAPAIEQVEMSRSFATMSMVERIGFAAVMQLARISSKFIYGMMFNGDASVRPNKLLPLEGAAVEEYDQALAQFQERIGSGSGSSGTARE